jgi:hypothetical protein
MRIMKSLSAAVLVTVLAAPAWSNEPPQSGTAAKTSEYAGQETRVIKSLAAADIASLLAGEGAGYAKAAELNGYPGPVHALELAAALALDANQVEQTRVLMDQHRSRAKELGARLVAAERALDELFATRQATVDTVEASARDVGLLQASLRAEHLKTHLAQRALFNAEQTRKYTELRGYGLVGSSNSATPANMGHGTRHH